MRYSRTFIHTLFEVPKEAETPSHVLLLRGCYMAPLMLLAIAGVVWLVTTLWTMIVP